MRIDDIKISKDAIEFSEKARDLRRSIFFVDNYTSDFNAAALYKDSVFCSSSSVESDVGAEEGLILTKPGTVVTESTIKDIAIRLHECGYTIVAARKVCGDEIKRRNIARRHYLAHTVMAESGKLYFNEWKNLLSIYETEEFLNTFGINASDALVFPTIQFSQEYNVPLLEIDSWSVASSNRYGLNSGNIYGPNEVGDYLFVNLFNKKEYSDHPVFLINPHMPGILNSFYLDETACYAFWIKSTSKSSLTWKRMRKEFCGGSDPETALPGSLRRDAWEGIIPISLKDGTRINRSNNGFHMSNGSFEALRELCLWFDVPPEETNIGKQLIRLGIDVAGLINCAFIRFDNNIRVLAELTNGCGVNECANLIKAGTMLGDTLPASNVDEHQMAKRDFLNRSA